MNTSLIQFSAENYTQTRVIDGASVIDSICAQMDSKLVTAFLFVLLGWYYKVQLITHLENTKHKFGRITNGLVGSNEISFLITVLDTAGDFLIIIGSLFGIYYAYLQDQLTAFHIGFVIVLAVLMAFTKIGFEMLNKRG